MRREIKRHTFKKSTFFNSFFSWNFSSLIVGRRESDAIKLDKAEDKASTLGPFFDVGLVPARPYLSLLSQLSSSSQYLAVVLVFLSVEA